MLKKCWLADHLVWKQEKKMCCYCTWTVLFSAQEFAIHYHHLRWCFSCGCKVMLHLDELHRICCNRYLKENDSWLFSLILNSAQVQKPHWVKLFWIINWNYFDTGKIILLWLNSPFSFRFHITMRWYFLIKKKKDWIFFRIWRRPLFSPTKCLFMMEYVTDFRYEFWPSIGSWTITLPRGVYNLTYVAV